MSVYSVIILRHDISDLAICGILIFSRKSSSIGATSRNVVGWGIGVLCYRVCNYESQSISIKLVET